MPNSRNTSPAEMNRWVRSALAHLYDVAFLQTHPLGTVLDTHKTLDAVSRAQRVRRLLLDGIESLRPQSAKTAPAAAVRAYAILTYRYVDGLTMDEVMDKLSLSRRQTYREHEKGIEAIACLLADQHSTQSTSNHPSVNPSTNNLELAQIEVSRLRQSVHTEVLNLNDVLDGVLALLSPMAEQAGVQIELPSAAALPSVQADRVQVRQALIGVLAYALEIATTAVQIRLAQFDADQAEIEVLASHQAAYPCDSAALEVGGDCVELAVAKTLIEAQGGQAAFSSTQNHWRAVLRLPALQQASLLVIDDNADLVELFRRYLGGYHIKVIGVNNSADALQLAAELQPALILLDVMMPGLDGWEVLQHLRATPETNQIPVVVCSVMKEHKLAHSMGASGYLAKPVSQSDFLEMAKRWLGVLRPAS